MGIDPFTAGIAAVGLGVQVLGQRKQERAQKKALAANQEARAADLRQQNLEQQRERRRFIREARIKRAAAISSAGGQGVSLDSSIVPGVTGAIATQTSSGINFLEQSAANAAAGTAAGEGLAKAQSQFATGQAVSQLGGTIFSNSTQIADIFSPRSAT